MSDRVELGYTMSDRVELGYTMSDCKVNQKVMSHQVLTCI